MKDRVKGQGSRVKVKQSVLQVASYKLQIGTDNMEATMVSEFITGNLKPATCDDFWEVP